jgi:hypothetical protein
MMKSEFIDRTGFEPTAAEYREIENEYMGTDLDKDVFCKQWKKQGGFERLMRLRARKIEELEAKIAEQDKLFEERTQDDAIRYKQLVEKNKKLAKMYEDDAEVIRLNLEKAERDLAEEKARADDAERKLKVIKEAFAIIVGKEDE